MTDNWVMSLRPHPLETLLAALAGWLPVLAGGVLLGMTLITPEWVGWRELLWQRDMLRLQAEGLETQRASYAAFNDALMADDPVLLERLAYTHLRYKPAGKRLLAGVGEGHDRGDLVTMSGETPHHAGGWYADGVWVGMEQDPGIDTGGVPEVPEVIEAWLSTPQPVVGRDIAAYRPMNTRLTRLTTGNSRFVLMLVGIVCLLVGLWPEKSRETGASGTLA